MITKGRCLDCGESIDVRRRPHQPGEILPHDCPSHPCQYESCPVRRLAAEMVELSPGERYCPTHGLLALARELVALVWLSPPRPEAGSHPIVKLVSGKLPDVVEKITQDERRLDGKDLHHGR